MIGTKSLIFLTIYDSSVVKKSIDSRIVKFGQKMSALILIQNSFKENKLI